MNKRKPLGGAANKATQLGQIKGLNQAAQALDAPMSPDSGELKHLPLDEVRPDPNNARRLKVDLQMLRQDQDDVSDPRQRMDIEDIQGLATTIKSLGQRSPIEVVRDGAIYRIVFGERRYWAAQLANQSTIKALVLRAAPDNVPLVQLIENIQHKQLPLFETILNIRSVIEREAERGRPLKDATDLIDRTGLARSSAYRYWRYVDLPNDVDAALEEGVISSHDDLSELLKYTSVKERKDALKRYISTGTWNVRPIASTPVSTTTRKRGRPRASISFGSTQNSDVAKTIFERIDPSGDYSKIDFTDHSAVTKAWKQLLQELERSVKNNG